MSWIPQYPPPLSAKNTDFSLAPLCYLPGWLNFPTEWRHPPFGFCNPLNFFFCSSYASWVGSPSQLNGGILLLILDFATPFKFLLLPLCFLPGWLTFSTEWRRPLQIAHPPRPLLPLDLTIYFNIIVTILQQPYLFHNVIEIAQRTFLVS